MKSATKTISELEIVIGERIGNSRLYRRFQGEREISPLYASEPHEIEVDLNAQREAERYGFEAVTVGRDTYFKSRGEWYWWAGPQVAAEANQ